jgi:hypothetical protein
MSPRRQETSLPANNQPVRFYKFVALSFLCLTLLLLGIIGFMSSKRATITITTKEEPIDIEATITIGGKEDGARGMVTTTLITFEQNFSPTGSKKEPGTATGKVILHNETTAPQALVATTRLLTADGVLFRLKEAVIVPVKGTIEASVHADQKGETGDIGPQKRFTIPGLNESKQQVIYASSKDAMTGGLSSVGVLSLSDIEKAKKQLLEAIQKKGEEILQKKYPDQPALFFVIQEAVEHTAKVGEETGSFLIKGKATVLGVFYEQDMVRSTAEQALKKHAVDDVGMIRTTDKEPKVVFDSYNPDKGTADLTVFHNGVVMLNAESKQLQKMLFFGKTKEEVRRYLLSLDHVYGVDVSFRPMWVGTVPYVPDHVSIVVKQVE